METLQGPTGNIKPHRIENPQATFWFQRHDGSIFFTTEREAWMVYNGRIQTLYKVPPPKLIGVSDGTIFYQSVKDAHQLYAEGKVEEAVQKLKEGEKLEMESGLGKLRAPINYDSVDKSGFPVDRSKL